MYIHTQFRLGSSYEDSGTVYFNKMKNHDIGNVLRKISEALVYLLLSPLLMLHRS